MLIYLVALFVVPMICMAISDYFTHSWGRWIWIFIATLCFGLIQNNLYIPMINNNNSMLYIIISAIILLIIILIPDFVFNKGLFNDLNKKRFNITPHKAQYLFRLLQQKWIQIGVILFMGVFIIPGAEDYLSALGAIITMILIVLAIPSVLSAISDDYENHKNYYNSHHFFSGTSKQIHDYWYKHHFFS